MAMTEAAPTQTSAPLTAQDHARVMADYSRAGEARARALGNRGPIRFDADGKLDRAILDSYWTHGFYVLRGRGRAARNWRSCAPMSTRCWRARRWPDAEARPQADRHSGWHHQAALSLGQAVERSRSAARTRTTDGIRSRCSSRPWAKAAPAWTVELLDGNLHLMDAALRLYGHPGLLAWRRRSWATISCPTTR